MDIDAAIAAYGVDALSERGVIQSPWKGVKAEHQNRAEPRSESAPDPKPEPRVKDKDVFARFHDGGNDCVACGRSRSIQAHHILKRSQGGDDVLPNLVPLCSSCHGALHGTPNRAYGHRITAGFVESAIGRYISSEAGDDARWYLTGKLGVEASRAFLERLGVDL